MKSLEKSIIEAALFWPGSMQFPGSWTGHLPFAAWLAQVFKPHVLVELGTHSGNSYFAFCQAVKEAGLNTRCFAVDTWQGDEHAGYYENEVYDQVLAHNQARYSEFSKLLRTTFDLAVQEFSDGSVNLLHIDGLHTYEAVKHDFETWLPKLATGALVLLHDINVRERDFGVYRLWEELKAHYPDHLEFSHSHGLGVIQISAARNSSAPAWMVPGSEEQRLVHDFFTALGTRQMQSYDATRLKEDVECLNERIKSQEQVLSHTREQVKALEQTLRAVYNSKSWKITAPLRKFGLLIRRMSNNEAWSDLKESESAASIKPRTRFSALPGAITNLPGRIYNRARGLNTIVKGMGGLVMASRKAFQVFQAEGFTGLRSRIKAALIRSGRSAQSQLDEAKLSVVPFYLSPDLDTTEPAPNPGLTIGIHIHLYYPEMLDPMASRLANIPYPFDLYVSTSSIPDCDLMRTRIVQLLPRASKVVVEPVPNRGRDIAPLIIQFGERLSNYDVVAHFHSKKSPHCKDLAGWCVDIFDLLLGPEQGKGGRVSRILELLNDQAKIIYPEGQSLILKDHSGWGSNYEIAADILERHTRISIRDFPSVTFSEGSMFWARSRCLHQYLKLPLQWDDFPEEPIPPDGTLAHALERLPLVFASRHKGNCLRLHKGDSIHDFRHYEAQQDYSDLQRHSDIKVLTYYLPQFHPIAENDEWHGKGFTEWTKVKAANPLFQGHYQQHIPHPDIGYYILDDPEVFRIQSRMMKKAGVYGQIFYHYWFSGRMILEKPAQMLLNNKDINMPFSFCWANENWTRRWDGNEDNVLLKQEYSPQDAREFIRYLIPFFQDPRYIKIEGRPLLFIYRPASMPSPQDYIQIWAEECRAAGLMPPWVAAVLTRGAVDPRDYNMEAGVERVLHDWTGGDVPDVSSELRAYEPLQGSVLPYDQVADYYAEKNNPAEFPLFRSLVPIWDNTPRYGLQAYLVHEATPVKFQEWLEKTIRQTRESLPDDRRFILVNAWNEWAEGAHLEPDTRFGYAFLNSVGRALSDISPVSELNPDQTVPAGLRLHLSVEQPVLDQMRADPRLGELFLNCLAKSSIFSHCQVSMDDPLSFPELAGLAKKAGPEEIPDYRIRMRKIALFQPETIQLMLKTSLKFPESVVLPNFYDRINPVIEPTENGSVHSWVAHEAPFLIFPGHSGHGYKNFKVRADAHVFVSVPGTRSMVDLPMVTTIVRYHKKASLESLARALYCLMAMEDCIVVPLVAAQDLDRHQKAAVEKLLQNLPQDPGNPPMLDHYTSPSGQGDLRSVMLNKSLRRVKTRYAGFLDHDDLLMYHAYSHLIGRLKKTGKAVAFARVYSTPVNETNGLLGPRMKMYVSGYCYQDFVRENHAPLHSLLLDMNRLCLDGIDYYDDQVYLEDYLLTLQLITSANADWKSLRMDNFIGDYLHSQDGSNTLAHLQKEDLDRILSDPHYLVCKDRVEALKKNLKQKQHGIAHKVMKIVRKRLNLRQSGEKS